MAGRRSASARTPSAFAIWESSCTTACARRRHISTPCAVRSRRAWNPTTRRWDRSRVACFPRRASCASSELRAARRWRCSSRWSPRRERSWRPSCQRSPTDPTLTNSGIETIDSGEMQSRDLRLRLPHRGIDDRPQVDDPAEEEEPQYPGQTELQNRHPEPALHELAEAGNEEAACCGNHVTRGSLAGHGRVYGERASSRRESRVSRRCGIGSARAKLPRNCRAIAMYAGSESRDSSTTACAGFVAV